MFEYLVALFENQIDSFRELRLFGFHCDFGAIVESDCRFGALELEFQPHSVFGDAADHGDEKAQIGDVYTNLFFFPGCEL
jgi:hypothetical protein